MRMIKRMLLALLCGVLSCMAAPLYPSLEPVLMPVAYLCFAFLYFLALSSVIRDPYLTTLEKVGCAVVILLFSFFGMMAAGLYSTSRMKKRFKIDIPI